MTDFLPNSLSKNPKNVKRMGELNWIPIFCANCGTDGPYIPEDAPPFAFWLCNDCVLIHGVPAAMMTKPDEEFWQEIAQERMAKQAKEQQCLFIPHI